MNSEVHTGAPVSAGVLSPEQVAEIQALAALATPGPWVDELGNPAPKEPRDEAEEYANCIFFLHSRTDVPQLCVSHEILRADKERLERELAEVRERETARIAILSNGAKIKCPNCGIWSTMAELGIAAPQSTTEAK